MSAPPEKSIPLTPYQPSISDPQAGQPSATARGASNSQNGNNTDVFDTPLVHDVRPPPPTYDPDAKPMKYRDFLVNESGMRIPPRRKIHKWEDNIFLRTKRRKWTLGCLIVLAGIVAGTLVWFFTWGRR